MEEVELKVLIKEGLNLNKYEFNLFMVIFKKGNVSAKGIIQEKIIPRQRIYDIGKNLEDKGMIAINCSKKPTIFYSVSIKKMKENILKNLQKEYEKKIENVNDSINKLNIIKNEK